MDPVRVFLAGVACGGATVLLLVSAEIWWHNRRRRRVDRGVRALRGDLRGGPPGSGNDSVVDPSEECQMRPVYTTAGALVTALEAAVGTGEEPDGLCADRDEHDAHLHHSPALGRFWCTADQAQREPWRSECRRRAAVNKAP